MEYYFGKISLGSLMRPAPMVVTPVEKYHSYLNFDEPEKSQLPRIDITMDDDYMLSRKDYTGCSVQISNASEYDLDKTEAKTLVQT